MVGGWVRPSRSVAMWANVGVLGANLRLPGWPHGPGRTTASTVCKPGRRQGGMGKVHAYAPLTRNGYVGILPQVA